MEQKFLVFPRVEQSVKQGDALSCSLFILCMDPLIRKFNSDDTIEGLNIRNPILIDKLCGYADDIVFIIKDRRICYKERLKCYNPNAIKGIIRGRIRFENAWKRRMVEKLINGILEQGNNGY